MDLDHLRALVGLAEAKKPFVSASVIASRGSTPQKAGAHALIEPNGRVHGTLGGGCLEAECIQRALRCLDTGVPATFTLKLDEVTGWDDGLICGGTVRVFLNPLAAHWFQECRRGLVSGEGKESGSLIYFVDPSHADFGRLEWIPATEYRSHGLTSAIKGWRLEVEKGDCFTFHDSAESSTEYFAEPWTPAPRLLIAGGGHIGRAVCELSAKVGFRPTVIDDRPAFANQERFSGAESVVCGDIAEEMSRLLVDEQTYVLIVTRGHRHDGQVLAAVVNRPAKFIGMIGSRRKSVLIRKDLLEEGIASAETLSTVVSPVGLDIGGVTVDEIAVSIVAQLVAIRRQGQMSAGAMNFNRFPKCDDVSDSVSSGTVEPNEAAQVVTSI